MRFIFLIVICCLCFISCKTDSHKKPVSEIDINKPIVEELKSPVQGNSSLPRLYSNGNEVFLS